MIETQILQQIQSTYGSLKLAKSSGSFALAKDRLATISETEPSDTSAATAPQTVAPPEFGYSTFTVAPYTLINAQERRDDDAFAFDQAGVDEDERNSHQRAKDAEEDTSQQDQSRPQGVTSTGGDTADSFANIIDAEFEEIAAKPHAPDGRTRLDENPTGTHPSDHTTGSGPPHIYAQVNEAYRAATRLEAQSSYGQMHQDAIYAQGGQMGFDFVI